MRHYPTGFKRYERVHPREILDFIKSEIKRGYKTELGELSTLSLFDLAKQTTYLVTRDGVHAGFACVKFENGFKDCWLTYLYISPEHRRKGCAKYAIRGLKVNRCKVPHRFSEVLKLLKSLEFVESSIQKFAYHQTELECLNAAHMRHSRS